MANDQTATALLSQLDGIANAPLTAAQRDARARQLLEAAGVSAGELAKAMSRFALTWNQRKASECEVTIEIWLEAVRITGQSPGKSILDLLSRIHQSEVAAKMLRAGYVSGRDVHGRIVWTHQVRTGTRSRA